MAIEDVKNHFIEEIKLRAFRDKYRLKGPEVIAQPE